MSVHTDLIFLMKASTCSQMNSSQEESIFSCVLASQSSFMNMDEESSGLVKTQYEDMRKTSLNAISYGHISNEKPVPVIKAQANSSISNEEIKAFGTSFHTAKARGFEVIVDAEGRINYTKLLERITGDRKKLQNICKDNSGVLTIIRSYDEAKLLAWKEKYGLDLMPGNPGIKPEDKNSFLTSSAQKTPGHENSIVDMNEKYGLDLMGTFAPIKPEGKNSFLSRSAQDSSSHENSTLDMNDKEGLNSMPTFAPIAQNGKISLPDTMTVSQLKQAGIFIEHRGKPNNIAGSYGPRYLLDIFIILTRPEYYKLIHELLDSIDDGAQLKNRSFDEELRRTIGQKQEENEKLREKFNRINREHDKSFKRLNKRNRDLNSMIREMNRKLDEAKDEIRNQTTALTQARTELHDQTTALAQARTELAQNTNELTQARTELQENTMRLTRAHEELQHQTHLITNLQDLVVEGAQETRNKINELGDNLRANFSRMNVTSGRRAETINIWTNFMLDLTFHEQELAEENEEVLDTFAGDQNHPERIKQYSIPPDPILDECLGTFPNANAIDICVYAQEHIHEYPHIRFYSPTRKLIAQHGYREEALNFIRAYANHGSSKVENLVDNYRIESIHLIGNLVTRLQDVMTNQREQLNQMHQNINNQNNMIHQVQANVQEIHEEIAQVNDHIEHQEQAQKALNHEIHELQQTNVELRNELQALRDIINARLPGATQIWYNRAYRNIMEENGRLVCEVLRNSNDRHVLNEDELRNLRLRRQ